jgi:hypothetical protein
MVRGVIADIAPISHALIKQGEGGLAREVCEQPTQCLFHRYLLPRGAVPDTHCEYRELAGCG